MSQEAMQYTREQYLDAADGFFGADEETSHNIWSFVKTRKEHECSGIEHDGEDISKGSYALRESAIHVDMGRVTCYVCLSCVNKWIDETKER